MRHVELLGGIIAAIVAIGMMATLEADKTAYLACLERDGRTTCQLKLYGR